MTALLQRSYDQKQLVVFTRHLGCTYCREMLSDLAADRDKLEREGIKVVVVHMGPEAKGRELLQRYSLEDLEQICDLDQELYQAFKIPRGSLMQVLGPKTWLRALSAFFFGGHGVGSLAGDPFQMPGVFLLENGAAARTFRYGDMSERANFSCFLDGTNCKDVVSEVGE